METFIPTTPVSQNANANANTNTNTKSNQRISLGQCVSFETDERNITHYYINNNRVCYSYYGIYYADSFQQEWALHHLPQTGPHECLNCLYYGTYNGIFIGYCLNCANNEYSGTRGNSINGKLNHNDFDVINLSLFHSLHILKKDDLVDVTDILDMINDKYDALIDLDDEDDHDDSVSENDTELKSFNTDDLYSHNNGTDDELEMVEEESQIKHVLNYDEINNHIVDPRDKYQEYEEFCIYPDNTHGRGYGSNYDGGYDSH
jgi:hypothetical protein